MQGKATAIVEAPVAFKRCGVETKIVLTDVSEGDSPGYKSD